MAPPLRHAPTDAPLFERLIQSPWPSRMRFNSADARSASAVFRKYSARLCLLASALARYGRGRSWQAHRALRKSALVPLLWVTKKADEPFSCFSDHSFAVASGLDSFPERMKEVPARFNSISGQQKTRESPRRDLGCWQVARFVKCDPQLISRS